MGRRTKLTPAIRDKITELISGGHVGEVAAVACGLSKPTYYNWLKKGREAKTGVYKEFFDAVKKAEADAEIAALESIKLAAKNGTWQASAWMLERRWRQRWGRNITQFNIDMNNLTDEQLERIANGEHPSAVLANPSVG